MAVLTRVIHPGHHKDAELKRRSSTYLKGGMGGLVGFELKGGMEAGKRFIDSLKMFYHVANIGDVRSLAIHPASTTHSQLSETEQLATGVTPGYIRLSVGIEHINDIIADLDQALAQRHRKAGKGGLRLAELQFKKRPRRCCMFNAGTVFLVPTYSNQLSA